MYNSLALHDIANVSVSGLKQGRRQGGTYYTIDIKARGLDGTSSTITLFSDKPIALELPEPVAQEVACQ